MVQKLFGAAGIVAVLILAGILISNSGTNADVANLAIKGGVMIGIIFGVLGAIGILITLAKRVS